MIKFETGKIYAKRRSFNKVYIDYYIRVTKRNNTTVWFEGLLLNGRVITPNRPYRRVKEWDGKEYIGDYSCETIYADDVASETAWEQEVIERKAEEKLMEKQREKRLRTEADQLREWLNENNVTLADAVKIHNRMMSVSTDVIKILQADEETGKGE